MVLDICGRANGTCANHIETRTFEENAYLLNQQRREYASSLSSVTDGEGDQKKGKGHGKQRGVKGWGTLAWKGSRYIYAVWVCLAWNRDGCSGPGRKPDPDMALKGRGRKFVSCQRGVKHLTNLKPVQRLKSCPPLEQRESSRILESDGNKKLNNIRKRSGGGGEGGHFWTKDTMAVKSRWPLLAKALRPGRGERERSAVNEERGRRSETKHSVSPGF